MEQLWRGLVRLCALAAVCSCSAFACRVLTAQGIDREPSRTPSTAQPPAAIVPPPSAAPAVLLPAPAAKPKDPETLFAVPTPLSEQQLAVHLAAAWSTVVGEPAGRETLAVLWAHSALETGRGQKMLGHNFAGLKGHAQEGGGRLIWTWDESSRGLERVRRTFRVYPSAEQGARDYVELLTSRHRRARRAAERGSPQDFVAALAESDYFTHDVEQYTRSVTSLMLEYLKKNPEPVSEPSI
jgi:hypothetical protein